MPFFGVFVINPDTYLAPVVPYIQHYGYPAIFIAVFLESLGLPLPGETMLIAASFMAVRGHLGIVPLLLTVWVAAVAGDNVGYAIGRFGGRRLVVRFGARVGMSAERIAKVERFFRRYGGGVVIFARFVVVARQLNGVVAGIGGMWWWRFFAFNALGAALWVGVWGGGVYAFGHAVSRWDEPHVGAWAYLIAVAAVIVVGVAGHWWWRHGRTSARLRRRISGEREQASPGEDH